MRLYISMVAFIWTQIPGVLDHLDLSSKTVLFALMLDGTLQVRVIVKKET